MPTTTTPFVVVPLPASQLDRIRGAGVDDFDNSLSPTIDETGGSPLRCCLRDSSPGERIALIAYRPFPWSGPYAEVGPVFIHAEACNGYGDPHRYPEGFAHRRQLLRAYDHDRRIIEGLSIKDGAQALRVLSWMLSRPEIDFVHSRNLEWGCYMFTVQRTPHEGPQDRS